MKKSLNNESIVDFVMEEMTKYISEERTVDGLVRMYAEQGKTRPYIEQKLRAKKFAEDIVTATINSHKDSFTSWAAYEQVISRKVTGYLDKNKSRKYIIGTLGQKYPNFKQDIATLVDATSPDETEALQEELIKLSKKYDITNRKEQQKVIQKLCLKGFGYDAIKKVMSDTD